MKVCFVAAPLMARSGVYRSAHDIVQEARSRGHDWTALIGLRPEASGTSEPKDGVREVDITAHGRDVLAELEGLFSQAPEVLGADVVVTLITQSDIAMSHIRKHFQGKWVAFVRGLPWPDRDEQTMVRRIMLRAIETRALRRADDVWATTPVLATQIANAREAFLVPAGIPGMERVSWGEDKSSPLVWAGRVDVDKRPAMFVELVEQLGISGRIFGEGPLKSSLMESASASIEWGGWASPDELWKGASMFVGTSRREAFGRSAVEAACAGLPIIVGENYGAAPFLYTDPDLKSQFVIEEGSLGAWVTSISALLSNDELRRRVSDHVHANATQLTISASVDHMIDRMAMITR